MSASRCSASPLIKVLHVIPSVSQARGGPSAALPMLIRACVGAGYAMTVATTDDDGRDAHLDVPLSQMRRQDDGADYIYFRRQSAFYSVSFPLRAWLNENVRGFALVHIHAMFSFASAVAARAACRDQVPYIVRPLGVLNQWGMRNRRPLLKQLSLRLVESAIVRNAAAIHYTSSAEKAQAGALGPAFTHAPAWVIPLPVDLSSGGVSPNPNDFYRQYPENAGKEVVLFLSRIDPKKGIELLLEAFGALHKEFPNSTLVIAGDGAVEYVSSLRKLATQLGIADRTIWPGFLSGPNKAGALSAATVFALPSYSENFGIAAVEALAAGVPVLLSDRVAVADDVRQARAGMVVACNTQAIAEGLRELLRNPSLRSAFAARGLTMAREHYSLAAAGNQLEKMYESVMDQAKP